MRSDLLIASRRAQILHKRHFILAAKVNKLNMLYFRGEVNTLAFRVQTTLSRIQIVNELFGQILVIIGLNVFPLDDHTARELEQRGNVVDKVAREPLNERVVAQRELPDVQLD